MYVSTKESATWGWKLDCFWPLCPVLKAPEALLFAAIAAEHGCPFLKTDTRQAFLCRDMGDNVVYIWQPYWWPELILEGHVLLLLQSIYGFIRRILTSHAEGSWKLSWAWRSNKQAMWSSSNYIQEVLSEYKPHYYKNYIEIALRPKRVLISLGLVLNNEDRHKTPDAHKQKYYLPFACMAKL
jgi:hypothetical protein